MATKSTSTSASKRTKVENLPKTEKRMSEKDMKKVKGGLEESQLAAGAAASASSFKLYGRKGGDDKRQDY